jgi:ribose transport system permease protein
MAGARGRVAPARPATGAPRLGVLVVLALLGAFFSLVTLKEQQPEGARAAQALMRRLAALPAGTALVAVGRDSDEDRRFTAAVAAAVRGRLAGSVTTVNGEPAAVRAALAEAAGGGGVAPTIVVGESYLGVVRGIVTSLPALAGVTVMSPPAYRWPTFLLPSNLRNIANQIAVIAILAIGMTMVIITGGIDLSVGSLIALAAVIVAWTIGRLGGEGASTAAMVAAALATIALCSVAGAFSGVVVTRFRVPPFIATLGMMQVASGVAYIISQGKPIYRIPERFVALGRGADPLLAVPWAVWLMAALYAAAHLLMGRTVLGRYLYAVGGNPEAARLAGVPVNRVLLFAYVASAALAGLGGVVMASQLRSGAPTYGLMYELYVVAAVVVGGTSLTGGEGTIAGTLAGAFIIAVIQNGMNLTNVESYTQKVVLGLVILGAVLLDRARRHRRPGPDGGSR